MHRRGLVSLVGGVEVAPVFEGLRAGLVEHSVNIALLLDLLREQSKWGKRGVGEEFLRIFALHLDDDAVLRRGVDRKLLLVKRSALLRAVEIHSALGVFVLVLRDVDPCAVSFLNAVLAHCIRLLQRLFFDRVDFEFRPLLGPQLHLFSDDVVLQGKFLHVDELLDLVRLLGVVIAASLAAFLSVAQHLLKA